MISAAGKNAADTSYGQLLIVFGTALAAILALLAIAHELGASESLIVYLLAGCATAAFIAMALSLRTSDPTDYFAARRDLPGFSNGMAIAASWLSASVFFGAAGSLFAIGFDGTAYLIGWCAGFAAAGILIAPYLRRSGAYTVAELLGARFGPAVANFAALVVLAGTCLLLVVQLQAIGLIASRTFELPYVWTVLAASGVLVLLAVPGGLRGLTLTQAAQLVLAFAAFLVPLFFYLAKSHGISAPQLAYGTLLPRIADLEIGMVEKQLADPLTLKPHLSAFLQLDRFNYIGVVIGLAAGTAAMPHLLMRYGAASTPGAARYAAAWVALFALLILTAAPAYAVFGKFEVYRLIEAGTKFAELPDWFARISGKGLVEVHGTSLALFSKVSEAVRAGNGTSAAIEDMLRASSSDMLRQWMALTEEARQVLAGAAKSAQLSHWDVFRGSILPRLAALAGNVSGGLVHDGVVVRPYAVMQLVQDRAEMPHVLTALVAIGGLSALLAAGSALAFSAANALAHDLGGRIIGRKSFMPGGVTMSRIALIAIIVLAMGVALRSPLQMLDIAIYATIVFAAGLFAPLVLGIWWRRMNVWGALAGMIAGIAISLYYLIATRYFPVAFHDLWGGIAIFGFEDRETYEQLRAVWQSATGSEQAAHWAALAKHVAGTDTHGPGMANWFGLHRHAVAIVALPGAILASVFVSLVTSRPADRFGRLVDGLRRPDDGPILHKEPAA